MHWFDFVSPHTAQEAVELLAGAGGKARVLAGGTDLLVQMRTGRRKPELVVDLKKIPDLNELSLDPGGLTLGAAVPCYRVYSDPAVVAAYPGLHDVVTLIGGTQIQGRASIGGNLCNSAPSADAVPLLIAMGVTCRILGPAGEREVAVEDFCTAPGKNVLGPAEILLSLRFPAPKPNSGAHYLRFIPRNEMDIAVAGVGAAVELDNGNFRSVRVGLASVAPTPLFVRPISEALEGKPVQQEAIDHAAELARQAARPISDMRGTDEYRVHLCGVLTRRALNTAIDRAREAH